MLGHAREQACRIDIVDYESTIFWANEVFVGSTREERQQRREIAVDVEECNRLVVQPELRPRDRLEELVEGTKTARQCDESVGQIGHQRLPLVHARDDTEVGEPL